MKIELQTDGDLTPKGKRVSRVVKTAKNGKKIRPTIAWYVGGKLFRHLDVTTENLALSHDWVRAA